MHSRSGGGRFRGELLSALNGKAAFSSAACAVYWTNRSAISPMRGPVIFPARRQQSKRSKMGRSKKDAPCVGIDTARHAVRSEEHTSELQSLMRNSYAVFCLKKQKSRNMISTYDKLKQHA